MIQFSQLCAIGRRFAVASMCAATLLLVAERAAAQCDSCAAPTLGYQPAAAYQPTVAYLPTFAAQPAVAATPVALQPAVSYTPYNGWYPGKWLDQMRMRRWSNAAPATSTTAGYPVYPAYGANYAAYSASYVPYSAGYAPYAASYAPAAAAPYVSSYAPLQSAYQTSYYAPTTVLRPAILTPVTAAYQPAMSIPTVDSCNSGCSACATVEAPACSACSAGSPLTTYDANMAPASYGAPVNYGAPATYSAPAAGCSSCAAAATTYGGGVSDYPASAAPAGSLQIPQPQLTVPPPAMPSYGTQHPAIDGTLTPEPAADDAKAGAVLEPPQLLTPYGDRTANRPTVDVRPAVYRTPAAQNPAAVERVSTATPRQPSRQAVQDAAGWSAVGR